MESLELFLEQQGSIVPKEPMWRGKRISLFKFYNLVVQNGGFENVSRGPCYHYRNTQRDTTSVENTVTRMGESRAFVGIAANLPIMHWAYVALILCGPGYFPWHAINWLCRAFSLYT